MYAVLETPTALRSLRILRSIPAGRWCVTRPDLKFFQQEVWRAVKENKIQQPRDGKDDFDAHDRMYFGNLWKSWFFGVPISVVDFHSYCKECKFCGKGVIPQMARAIGVLTSNSRGPWLRLWQRVWCHGGVPLLNAICEFVGAMVWCYCWVPWWGTIAGCHAVSLLGCHFQGAIRGCHWCYCGVVPWWSTASDHSQSWNSVLQTVQLIIYWCLIFQYETNWYDLIRYVRA